MALSKESILKTVETSLTPQNVNKRLEWEWTPLMDMADSGNCSLARTMIRNGADVHLRNWKGQTALHLASSKGHKEMVELLVDSGSNVDEQDEAGRTPLMLAAKMGQSGVIRKLLLAGAKVGLEDAEGQTALHYAAEGNHIDCGTFLVEAGEDVTAADVKSRTPLDIASVEFTEATQQTLSQSFKQVVVVAGDAECGTGILMAALQVESKAFSKKLAQRHEQGSQAAGGAGSAPLAQLPGRKYKEALFYNFEGEAGNHGPLRSFMETMMSKLGGSVTLLILVKTTEEEDTITQQLHRWLQPLALTSATSTPQIIVVGSSSEQGESRKQAYEKLQRCTQVIQKKLNVHIKGHTVIDSRYMQLEGLNELSGMVRNSSQSRRDATNIPYNLSWVASKIQSSVTSIKTLQLHEFAKWVNDTNVDLPKNLPSPEEVCQDLSEAGHTLFLPNKQDPSQSWLILDLPALLHDVYGTMFSGSQGKVNQFGLLHSSQLTELFPEWDPAMIQEVLTSLEFCIRIDPLLMKEELAKLTTDEGRGGWLYFPALVSAQPPHVFPDNRDPQLFQWMSWQLRTDEESFISAHLLQTIILRLAANHLFSHKLSPNVREHSCNFWKNGLAWSSKGVDIAVQISDSSVVQVVGRSNSTSEDLHQYTSTVMRDIIQTTAQMSPKLEATPYIVHPYTPAMWVDPKASPRDAMYPVSSIDRCISDVGEHVLSLPREPGHIPKQMPLRGLFGGHSPPLPVVKDIAIYSAESALNDLCWIPHGIRSLPIDDQGGEFQLEPITKELGVEGEEAVSLEVPRGAITPRGASVEVRYAVIPDGPFVPPDGYQFGSMVVYLYYDGQCVTRPITLHLPRWYGGVDHKRDGVTLAMAPHTLKEGEEKYQFKVVEGREAATWMRRQCGSHNLTGHCSLFAEVFRLGSTPTYYASLWTNQYSPTQVCSKVVVTYSHRYWLELVPRYWKGWKRADKRVPIVKFKFNGSEPEQQKVRGGLAESHGPGWSASVVGGDTVRSSDVAYHGKYSLKKLQEEVEEEIYPPSIHCTVAYRSPPRSSGQVRQIALNIIGTKSDQVRFPIEVIEVEYAESHATIRFDSTPTLQQLDAHVVDEVASSWDRMALHLGVQASCIQIVRRDHPNDCVGACRDVMHKWLKGDRNTGNEMRTWHTVHNALQTSGYRTLAELLRGQIRDLPEAVGALSTSEPSEELFSYWPRFDSVARPLHADEHHQRLETIQLEVVKDATMQTGYNLASFQYLLVGNHRDWPKKRFVIQFEDLPRHCTNVERAVMYLKYAYAHKASWMTDNEVPYITRELNTHRILRPWDEQAVYSTYMEAGIDYIPEPMEKVALPYEGNEGQLANGYVPFSVIQAVKKWASGATNCGILVMDLKEAVLGRDRRFWSSKGPRENRPYLEVTFHSNGPPAATGQGQGATAKVKKNYLS